MDPFEIYLQLLCLYLNKKVMFIEASEVNSIIKIIVNKFEEKLQMRFPNLNCFILLTFIK